MLTDRLCQRGCVAWQILLDVNSTVLQTVYTFHGSPIDHAQRGFSYATYHAGRWKDADGNPAPHRLSCNQQTRESFFYFWNLSCTNLIWLRFFTTVKFISLEVKLPTSAENTIANVKLKAPLIPWFQANLGGIMGTQSEKYYSYNSYSPRTFTHFTAFNVNLYLLRSFA